MAVRERSAPTISLPGAAQVRLHGVEGLGVVSNQNHE
jgi:hypothetical protein